MKSVLHAEVLAALRRVASVPSVRLEGRGNLVLKQHSLLD